MDLRRSFGWAAVGLGTVAGMIALARALGQWRVHSLDEQRRALVAERQYAGIGLWGAAWIQLEEAVRLAPAYTGLRRNVGAACRGTAARSDVADQLDLRVAGDRQEGALK
jgi:hypothetical protein